MNFTSVLSRLKKLSAFVFMTFIFSSNVQAAQTTQPSNNALFKACLVQAQAKETANARDQHKMLCLKNFSQNLPSSSCLAVAQGMAYFSSSNKAKLFCGSELSDISPKKCLQIARQITFSETADELKWTCIQRFKGDMSQKQCLEFAKDLSLVPMQNRAMEYCSN